MAEPILLNTHPGVGATVNIRIQFKNETDAKRWGNTSWTSTGHDLRTTMPDFMSHLHHYILDIRKKKYQPYEQQLHSRHRMIHTAAYFVFGDIRDQRGYLTREHGRWRLETMKDLMLSASPSGDELAIEIVVWIDDIPGNKLSTGAKLQEAAVKYHCYGVGKVRTEEPEDEHQQHESMTVSVLQPYKQFSQDEEFPDPILVPQRRVNGASIGCAEDTMHLPNETARAPWEYIDLYKGLGDAELENKMQDILHAKLEPDVAEEPGIPRLPPITNNPYHGKVGVEEIPQGNISLSVRMISRLQAIHSGAIKLPPNWLEVRQSHETVFTLCRYLKGHVYEICSPEQRSHFFGKGGEGRWRMDVWVMPQSAQVEKLYFVCSNDKLYKYLDPVMVSSTGERKLHIEVHLCVM